MPRPRNKRCVHFWPQTTCFKPVGVPLRLLQEIALSGDELEAIRLKDLEGLDQVDVAERMKISRPTVVRILQSARKKIADMLVNGKAINLEKGQDIIIHDNKCKCHQRHGRTL